MKKEWLGKQLTLQNLVLILLLMIFVLPRLLTIDTGIEWLNFRNTGQIGDTIGGLSGPFINALSAILVYIAFKEQVLANKIIKNQQNYQFMQEQLNRLEDNIHNIDVGAMQLKQEIVGSVQRSENDSVEGVLHYNRMGIHKLIYVAALFLELNREILKISEPEPKAYFSYKIRLLYRVVYQHFYLELYQELIKLTNNKGFLEQDGEFLKQVEQLEAAFAENNENTRAVEA